MSVEGGLLRDDPREPHACCFAEKAAAAAIEPRRPWSTRRYVERRAAHRFTAFHESERRAARTVEV